MSTVKPPVVVRVKSTNGRMTGVIVGNSHGDMVQVRWDGLGDETFPAHRKNLIIQQGAQPA